MERKKPVPGAIYRHFKGKLYQIISVAIHSETKEKLVIYQALYDDFAVYARPYDMFMSPVDNDKYPKVKQKYRFEEVPKEELLQNTADYCKEFKKDSGENKNFTEESKLQKETDFDKENCCEKKSDQEDFCEESGQANEDLLAFLDAETYEEKRNILVSMQSRITDRLIDDIAASMDITIDDGDLDDRYKSLMYCVSKRQEFENNRLR